MDDSHATAGIGSMRVQIMFAFSALAVLSLLMCSILLAQIFSISKQSARMVADEQQVRQSLELAAAIREQYIHISHTIIEKDFDHLDHYEDWRARVRMLLVSLHGHAPDGQYQQLNRIEEASEKMHQLFEGELLDAVSQGDEKQMTLIHRQIDEVSQDASGIADAFALSVEKNMRGFHSGILASAQQAFWVVLVSGALLLVLSLVCSYRTYEMVVRPLNKLIETSKEIGGGNLKKKLGDLGQNELQAVSRAFDKMIVELQLREKQLIKRERMAAIGQLSMGVAHEISNPATIILGYTKIMASDSSPATREEGLKVIREEAKHCERLAKDLLSFGVHPELEIQQLNVQALVEDMIRRLKESQVLADHDVRVNLEAFQIQSDPLRLRQVMINLVENSVQHSPKGSLIEIEGKLGPPGYYAMSIIDHGQGIAPQDLGRIFEPFFSKRKGGTGLGLPITKRIIELMGGQIRVEAEINVGTKFHLLIPLKSEIA